MVLETISLVQAFKIGKDVRLIAETPMGEEPTIIFKAGRLPAPFEEA
jgi:hypothetical protein